VKEEQAHLVFGGKTEADAEFEEEIMKNGHNEMESRLNEIKNSIIQNKFAKTATVAAAKYSRDDSHYLIGAEQHGTSSNRSISTGRRPMSASQTGGSRVKEFILDNDDEHTVQILRNHEMQQNTNTGGKASKPAHDNEDLGMFELTHSLLGKSKTISTMRQMKLGGREGAKAAVPTKLFTNDEWRLFNEITRTRKEIADSINQRRKMLEVAKTRQVQKTTKFATIRTALDDEKGKNQFVKEATNELSVLKKIQENIEDDISRQKIRIKRNTERIIWTMAPSGFANRRGKSMRGPVIGEGPLPPKATSDLKDPNLDKTLRTYYWDSAGRRHLRSKSLSGTHGNEGDLGYDFASSDESLVEQAMNAIRRIASNISIYKLDLKKVFEQFDTSGDGFLSAEEMAEAFLAMGVKLDIPTMKVIFE
jgi:hypothetical protein